MKKVFYLLLAACATLFVSCAKEIENPSDAEIPVNGKTITFTASITLPGETKAVLEDLDIQWIDGDYIGIATDNSADIVAYPVTPDPEDPTRGTITVTAVEGASAYYALFKGSLGHDGGANEVQADDFSDVSFNTSTKTFSGLSVGKQQVAEGSLTSHLWYSNGYPLAMAGKASGTSLVMKPCLALVKIQVAAESIPDDDYIVSETYNNPTYGVDHAHSYSAVRGFDVYQMGGSTIYSSGDYDVQIANDGSLATTVVNNDNKRAYRQLSQAEKLLPDTDYLMCLIPGGSISSFKINFLGYADNDGALLWDAAYTMTKSGDITVKPGDYFNFGTLNPLGRKKAKNHLEDDAADAAAAFVPAIQIDGEFDDWEDVEKQVFSTGVSRIVEWQFASDEFNLYFLYKIDASKIPSCAESDTYDWSPYIYIGFDTDSDTTTGKDGSANLGPGMEARAVLFPWRGPVSEAPQCVIGEDANGHFECPKGTTVSGIKPLIGGKIIGDYCYVEVRVPLSAIGSPASGSNITVNHSMSYQATGRQQITGTMVATIDASDQTVGVGQTVEIGATTNSSAPITYTSNNTAIATVDADGVITGVAQGSTTITLSVAAVEGAFTAATKDINVTVTAAAAIVIDGSFTDWNKEGVETFAGINDRIKEWKAMSDDSFVYFYYKITASKIKSDGSSKIYIGFDLDNDASTGDQGEHGGSGPDNGSEALAYFYPWDGTTAVISGVDATSYVQQPVGTTQTGAKITVGGIIDGDFAYVEISIPRESLGSLAATSGKTITVRHAMQYYKTNREVVTLK